VHGAEGPPSVLEGRFGLYDAFLSTRDAPLDEHLADLGERWEVLRIAYKAYPACHYMHGSLGATARLVGRVQADEIDEIVVTVPEAAVALVLEPAEPKRTPRSDYEAKFSLQYSAAAMLVHGRVNLQTYSAAALADPVVQQLAAKVRYEVQPYPTYPQAFPGGIRIRTRDGQILEEALDYQLGAPQNPMSEQDVRAKFRENASLTLDAASLDAVEEAICTLEEQDDVRAVFSLLALEPVSA
jgi:2-methylcitrate dehydratase PrpD